MCNCVTTLVHKIAKLCFLLIYCTTVDLDIQFLTKGIHLLIYQHWYSKTINWKCLKTCCKPFIYRAPVVIKIKFGIWVSDYRNFGLLDLRTIGHSDYRTVTKLYIEKSIVFTRSCNKRKKIVQIHLCHWRSPGNI
jgi:hypothetical protein